ncbi:MAG: aminotransferase class V-fold PLP-dependent enzyme [Bacteroidota bacterium]
MDTTTLDPATWLPQAAQAIEAWQATFGSYAAHPSTQVAPERVEAALAAYAERLQGNYPFFHPRYAGQMLKPPHPAAVIGYLAAQLINPNNHALDGGPPTSHMEKAVVRDLAAMFGLPATSLGHLTSGGTIGNLEALWVARELHPDRAIACSEAAHYTHQRMGQVLRHETVALPADAEGRLDLNALEDALKTGRIGTVVLTAGTTSLGQVDAIDDALTLRERYGVRIHVDAAYGGFFTLLAHDPGEGEGQLSAEVARHFRAIGACDSVVVDPHKHGLQPYGCGAILFRDPAVGRVYHHDSPYTYFTSDELHLGEISLECSRAGAAAGAFWFTTQLLPLQADEGLGPILRACRTAAQRWEAALTQQDAFVSYQPPDLDIVTYYPRTEATTASAVDAAAQRVFAQAMADPHQPFFVSVLRVDSTTLPVEADQPQARILRSVLMKPEHATYVPTLLDGLTAQCPALTNPTGS